MTPPVKCYACAAELTLDTLTTTGACPHCQTQLTNRNKCHGCHIIIHTDDLDAGACPVCGDKVQPMCVLDHCRCSHDLAESLAYCPLCGAAVCPECGCHDVSQISRITGYLSDVGGWNAAKQQELKDRHRVDTQEVAP